MSGCSDSEVQTDGVEYTAETLGVYHPTSMKELHKIIRRGMESEPEEGDFAFWMNKATKWKRAGDIEARKPHPNPEWLYVCCARTAVVILYKVLKHPDLNNQLTTKEQTILQHKASRLVGDVKVLKKQREEAYATWEAIERVRKQEIERDSAALQSILNLEEGQDKPLPAVPAQPPQSSSDGLHAIQTRVEEISRPGSPLSPESPVSRAKSNYLLNNRSRGNSPPVGEDVPPPPYTEEAQYDEIMRDIMEDGDSPDCGAGDAGSDYHIRVVEPDATSTRAVTPQLSPEIPLPLADEKQGNSAGYPGLQSRGRSGSRKSSIKKDKSRSRSGSAQGTMRVVNPTVSSEDEEQFRDAVNALEEAYKQLALLRKGGVRLPRGVSKRIEDLKIFL